MGRQSTRSLGEDFPDNAAFFDSSEAEIEAGVAVGEFLMIKAQQVEDSGVEVADMYWFFDGAKTDFVCGAVNHPGLDSGAGEPGAKGPGMVFSALGVGGVVKRSASKFRSPDKECVFQHSALFEIG